MNDLFSERYGYVVKALQFESLDRRVKGFLWDELNTHYLINAKEKFNGTVEAKDHQQQELWAKNAMSFYYNLWRDFLGQSIYNFPNSPANVNAALAEKFSISRNWYACFDTIEAVVRLSTLLHTNKKDYRKTLDGFSSAINEVLQEEKCSYRMVEGLIIPVTNNVEVITIASALTDSKSVQTVNTHLVQAVKHYSNRESPDYRNAIKEAISALESLLNLIVGTPKGTMGEALKLIKRNGTIELHPALQTSLTTLYGWASDESGVRHHLKDESNIDIDDAKMIIVTCCSFVSYFMAKAIKIGINLENK